MFLQSQQEDDFYFLSKYKDFFISFKREYVHYFVKLADEHARLKDEIFLQKSAVYLYSALFLNPEESFGDGADFLHSFKKKGVEIGFLAARTFLHLTQNFITQENLSKNDVAQFFSYLNKCIDIIEAFFDQKKIEKDQVFSQNTGVSIIGKSIIEEFAELMDEGIKVTFINIYKEVLLKEEGEIVEIEGDSAIFKLSPRMQAAMQLEGKTSIYIDTNGIKRHLKADVIFCNFYSGKTYLSGFVRLLNLPALNRRYVRVLPDIEATVSIGSENKTTVGRLFDISKEGLGVISEQNNSVTKNSQAKVSFQVKNDDEALINIEIDAEVMDVIQYVNAYRFCFKINSDSEKSDLIEQYVDKREKEILIELEEISKEYIAL